MPPPTVIMQTGHWAEAGETRNESLEIRNKKNKNNFI